MAGGSREIRVFKAMNRPLTILGALHTELVLRHVPGKL